MLFYLTTCYSRFVYLSPRRRALLIAMCAIVLVMIALILVLVVVDPLWGALSALSAVILPQFSVGNMRYLCKVVDN